LPPAEAELDEAVAYYNAQSAGLGAELASEIREGLARIEQRRTQSAVSSAPISVRLGVR
jgi:hypothetical protein